MSTTLVSPPTPTVRAPPPPSPATGHDHVFLGARHDHHARRTRWVVVLSLAVMAAELWGGVAFHSVALVADGLHMSTHAGAMLIAAGAYAYARRRAHDRRFAFGTGKIGDLTGFANGAGLLVVAALIGIESVERLLHPGPTAFGEAAAVAGLGAVVSLLSAGLLHQGHGHSPGPHGRDLNVWAAYLHMVADVVTSLLTVAALLVGLRTGWLWLDPAIGLLNAGLVASFALNLLGQAAAILLDMAPRGTTAEDARRALEVGGDEVTDLHVWRVGPGHLALVAQVRSPHPQPVAVYHERLRALPALSHRTIEVVPAEPA